jgi:DNA mismatch repair ATPase MutS
MYRMLRNPQLDDVERDERRRLIACFQVDADLRERVQSALIGLGFGVRMAVAASLLWDAEWPVVAAKPLLGLMAALAAVSLLTAPYFGAPGLLVFLLAFACNFILHHRTRFRFEPEMDALAYLGEALVAADRLGRIERPEIEPLVIRLRERSRAAAPLRRRIGRFSSGAGQDLLYEYVNIAFLLEARSLRAALAEIHVFSGVLRDVLELIGELDALQAVASFREGLPAYCEPIFLDDPMHLEVEEVYHPLLRAPVPNSIALAGRGALVTGTNMSGKSTFLRSLGLTVILGSTVCTCPARLYRGARFLVRSSLRVADDILRGESFYWAEAERLLQLIRSLEAGAPTLCLIDEMLAGTNSAERIAASVEILDFICRKGGLVVGATHELEVASQLQNRLDFYSFADALGAKGLDFEYRIRRGPSEARNALRLLRELGFPEDIVAGALRRAQSADRRRSRTGEAER